MEVPRAIELRDGGAGVLRLELNRNDKYARVVRLAPDVPEEQLARWYLPLSWPAALAEVLYLILRACAIALLLAVLVVVLGTLVGCSAGPGFARPSSTAPPTPRLADPALVERLVAGRAA